MTHWRLTTLGYSTTSKVCVLVCWVAHQRVCRCYGLRIRGKARGSGNPHQINSWDYHSRESFCWRISGSRPDKVIFADSLGNVRRRFEMCKPRVEKYVCFSSLPSRLLVRYRDRERRINGHHLCVFVAMIMTCMTDPRWRILAKTKKTLYFLVGRYASFSLLVI